MGRAPVAIVLALAPLGFGAAVLALGMDANWDLRNYHYYNAYAYLTGREGHDILAAQVNGFFNPLIDVPFYLATQIWPARVVGFLLGTVQGLNVLPLYGIVHATIASESPKQRRLVALALALLGMIGSGALSELGTTFYDNVVSLGPLTAFWLILRRDERLTMPELLAAGLLTGLAVGLKQPTVTLAIGLCLAFFSASAPLGRRVSLAFIFGTGVLLGIGVTAGTWMLHLWRMYGNPFFPFYNQIFRSPWALPQDYMKYFYIPTDWPVRLLFPFAYLLDPKLTSDAAFRDLRILVCFLLIPFAAAARLRRTSRAHPPWSPGARYLLAAFAISYIAWILLFCVYRYITALEMLAPLAITLAIQALPITRRARLVATVAVLGVTVAATQPADWIRVPWTDKWVSVDPPPIADPSRTIVLITGHEPLSYLIPSFPPAVRFIRIDSSFTGAYEPTVRFNGVMRAIVDEHKGPLLVLYNPNEAEAADHHLAFYDLAVRRTACALVPSNIGYLPYLLCGVERAPGGR
jgi:hypothetical protein